MNEIMEYCFYLDQATNYRAPSSIDIQQAVSNAFHEGGAELFKTFINDYKESDDAVKLAA